MILFLKQILLIVDQEIRIKTQFLDSWQTSLFNHQQECIGPFNLLLNEQLHVLQKNEFSKQLLYSSVTNT